MSDQSTAHPVGSRHVSRGWAIAVAAVTLALILGTLAAAIALSQRQSRSQMLSSFRLRGQSTATLISTYLGQQAARQASTASRFLAEPRVAPQRFEIVIAAFGGSAAVLLDHNGGVLAATPGGPASIQRALPAQRAALSAAAGGATTVSNVLPTNGFGGTAAAIAVPFQTSTGKRVLGVEYTSAGSALDSFVTHAIASPQHHVFLVDAQGRLLAASPATATPTLALADPALARAATRSASGAVGGRRAPSTFTTAPVTGTPWRLVMEMPNSHLYGTVSGLTQRIPWLVFAFVSVLGVLLVAQLARSLRDRERLAGLSRTMERTARTDLLTGLFNRRGLSESLIYLLAQARRREESMAVLMIDLDLFKQTNDHYGHDAGDRVLCAVSGCMREVLRATDLYGRWGGDEFLVALPNSDEQAARAVAERLRATAGRLDLRDIGLPDGVQMSVGIATGTHSTPDELVHAADVALYRAKATRTPSAAQVTLMS